MAIKSTPFGPTKLSNGDARTFRRQFGLYMPDDIVVVRNLDSDEAGDYRVMRHAEAAGNSNWEITDINPRDLE